MTFYEMFQTIINDIDESESDLELSKKIKNYINRGYLELAKRELLEKSTTINVVGGYFSKPYNLFKVTDIKKDGISVNYESEAKKIKVDVEGQVNFIYSYIPDKISSDYDEFETSESNTEFIVNYAKWLYFLNDGMIDEAKIYKSEYETMNVKRENYKYNTISTVYGVI